MNKLVSSQPNDDYEDERKQGVFENYFLRTIMGISCMNHIKIDLEIPNKITDISHMVRGDKIRYVNNSYKNNFTRKRPIKANKWPNMRRHKTTVVNGGKTDKRQNEKTSLPLINMYV